jgi:SpoVK/Ycf46/Vps4 family AAA+-type ATPase
MANELAGLTPGLVGADIQHVCNVAALMARRRGADAVVMQDLSNAIDRYTLTTIYYTIVLQQLLFYSRFECSYHQLQLDKLSYFVPSAHIDTMWST